MTPLKQLATLSAPEASQLVIQPYDKTSIPSIEKAIMTSDVGLTPGNDGNLIRINVPQLTAVSDSLLQLKGSQSTTQILMFQCVICQQMKIQMA